MHFPIHHAAGVIALSEHEQDFWARLGIESTVIPNWLDIPFIESLRDKNIKSHFPRPLFCSWSI